MTVKENIKILRRISMYKKTYSVKEIDSDGFYRTTLKDITYYEPNDITEENINKILRDDDAIIVPGYCPFCGGVTILNRNPHGWYVHCGICGMEGPKNWDPYSALKMFTDKSFKTVARIMELSQDKIKELLIENEKYWDANHVNEVIEFIKGE